MTGYERIHNILRHQKVDRIGLFEHFWDDTVKRWRAEGHLGTNERVEEHFNHDIVRCRPIDMAVRIGFTPVVVEETEETIVTLDANGATLRKHKLHDTTPEHIAFTVKDRESWERFAKPLLVPDTCRINYDLYRREMQFTKGRDRFFACDASNVFELMAYLCGHENLLVGMALDPDWVRDMTMTYSEMYEVLMRDLFEKEGWPDAIWWYEDMGFKFKPFLSPQMYREILFPAHRKTFAIAKERDLPIIVHSCGYIEPLIPGLVEAGMDCLQVLEQKAGMDLLRIYQRFGGEISFMGGVDARTLASNDWGLLDAELNQKIPTVMANNGYILHSDHSVPSTVDYATYRHFIEKGLQIGTYRS